MISSGKMVYAMAECLVALTDFAKNLVLRLRRKVAGKKTEIHLFCTGKRGI